MPVYNAGAYLEEAIQSIIDQTFTNFTLLLINNGSTDNPEAIINKFNDPRIWYIKHEDNSGLIHTLNEGLNLIKSQYIIRMDADDISLPQRMEKQVAFMDAHPEIDICGTWFSILGTDQSVKHPVTNPECKIKLLQNTVFGHPTVIFRNASITNAKLNYDTTALYAEDYKLWADASISRLELANIPEVLLHYRAHQGQVSVMRAVQQKQTVQNINIWYGMQYFSEQLKDKTKLYIQFLEGSVDSFAAFSQIRVLANDLKTENRLKNFFDRLLFDEFIDELLRAAARRIFVLCVNCDIKILWKSLSYPEFYYGTTTYQKAKFILKSVKNTLF